MHKLLVRQLARYVGGSAVSPEVSELLVAVDAAYQQADEDRRMLERALELVSEEMLDTNDRLRRDVAARARAEVALRKNEERLRILAKATRDAIWEYEVEGGRVSWSDNVEGLFGYPPDLTGATWQWWLERVHPEDRERVLDGLQSATTAATDAEWSVAFRFLARDGSYRDVNARALVIRDDNGRVDRIVGALADVTERNAIEWRLQLSERMAALGTVAASVAHEINNPMAYVTANLDFLSQHIGSDDPEVRALLEAALADARGGAARVTRTVRDLSAFSRMDDVGVEEVDPEAVVKSAVAMARAEILRRARLVLDLSAVPPVRAAEGRLVQVILNLLMNAVHAIPEGQPRANEIAVRTSQRDDSVLIEVVDTGGGMTPDVARRVFESFFTTKPRGVGTGLGMAISQRIVGAAGGRIDVESAVGRGTTVVVRLPTAHAVATSSRP